MEIFILRHCKTKNNIDNSWCGQKTDCELSEQGQIRNKELIKELSKINFDVIYCSPLKRCLVTAKELAQITNSKLVIDDRLIERDFGELEGLKCVEEDKLKMADLDLNTDLGKGVEKIKFIYENRVIPFYKELLNKNFNRVLIVTHSWIVRLSKYFLTGEKNKDVISQTPPNGTFEVFMSDFNLISRSFNSVTVEGNKLTKKSTYTSKFNDEINWMNSIPEELKVYIPKIYDYHISKENKNNDLSYITMEYLNEKSFDQIYLNKKLTETDVNNFFRQVVDFINKSRKYHPVSTEEKIKQYLYDMYYLKTVERWNEIKDDPKFSSFYNNDIFINNKKYKPVSYYLSKLEKTLNDYDLLDGKRQFSIIHGDLCFNNIIFKDNKMYVIDPRGSFGEKWIYGDTLYEIAKISHSISGYDTLINNLYKLEWNENNINYHFTNNLNQSLFKEKFEKLINKKFLPRIYLIESLLFLSMIPLHSESYEHQLIMLSLALEKLDAFIK